MSLTVRVRRTVATVLMLSPVALHSQSPRAAAADRAPALDAIRAADIRRDIDILAGDAMRGRESGTIDEIRAATWLADQLRAIGLEPAGNDGSFFQWWPLDRARLGAATNVTLDGAPLALWRDVVVTSQSTTALMLPRDASLDLPLVDVGDGSGAAATMDVKGKAVLVDLKRPANAPPPDGSVSSFRHVLIGMLTDPASWFARGAAAVILVPDAGSAPAVTFLAEYLARGSYALGGGTPAAGGAPVLLAAPSVAARMRAAGRIGITTRRDEFSYPSVNVIAKVTGTDPTLRNEYVIFSGHTDHDGVRAAVDGDSIMNGADDNASSGVALLAIARAWKRHPGKRSALFVMHGAEEKGLLGSRWHVAHPVVPLKSMVAVLDADMIGRNSPDSAVLLGAQVPHRSSVRLVELALRANAQVSRFIVDTTLDRPDQPEQAFFRSDHLPYVQAGVPGIFYSTWLQKDYHTVRDDPRLIDERKLARMAQWMYATGWAVSQARERITLDPGFKLER